ncbi:MAG: HAD-IIIA family hydrolase [Kiritimatiellae bacterium]|nr:HAD-IIIA family hydrolase [Kiritimatiellia bacterium]
MKSAVFIDRDGVLNRMVFDETHGILDSPRRRGQVEAVPGAGAFLREIRAAGNFVVVVTNQPGIAKGTLKIASLNSVNKELARQLAVDGGQWDELRFCPHHPGPCPGGNPIFVKTCACRKPASGLLLDAARDFDIDLATSWMIGDGLVDVAAGRRAGCRTILLTALKWSMAERFLDCAGGEPDFVCRNLAEALKLIRDGETPARQRES